MSNRKNEEITEWIWKDSLRCFWRVRIWKSGERSTGLEIDGDAKDFEWSYEIGRDEGVKVFVPVFKGTIVGQYDTKPRIGEIMLDFTSHIVSVAIGFSGSIENEK